MCVGEKRRLIVPPHLGYGKTFLELTTKYGFVSQIIICYLTGEHGAGEVIPPGATLHFETELLKIESAPPPVNVFKEIDVNEDSQLSRDEVRTYKCTNETFHLLYF